MDDKWAGGRQERIIEFYLPVINVAEKKSPRSMGVL